MAVQAKAFTTQFRKKIKEAKDTWTFFFDKPKKYDFFPGQYNRITLAIDPVDDRGNNRQFTISSSPTEKEFITITTKIIKSDFKKAFAALIPGTPIQFFGPLGGFYLREENKIPRIFLAGGIGITPFYSMIKYAANKKLDIPITLIVSFSRKEDIIFYDELKKTENQNSKIKVVYSISRPETFKGENKDLEKGRISEQLIKKYVKNVRDQEFMVTGSVSLVDSMTLLLQEMNIPEEQIKAEIFTGY